MLRLLLPYLVTALLGVPGFAQVEQPFPVDKTQTLRAESARYYVEGRQVIARNVKLTSLRQMTLVGRGENPTLVVEGVLDLRAVTGGWARLENLTVELAPTAKELMLMDTEIGSGAKLTCAEEMPSDAKVTFMGSRVGRGGEVDLLMNGGEFRFMSSRALGPIKITGAMRNATKTSNVKVTIALNTGQNGVQGGLLIDGAKDVTVRLSDLAGDRVVFANNESLDFHGNNVRCDVLEFRHRRGGRLPKAKITSNDFRCDQIRFLAPAKKSGQTERVNLSSCWFGGVTDDEAILEALIHDADDDPDSALIARIKQASESPIGYGGNLQR